MAWLFSRCTVPGVDRQAILNEVSFVDLLGKPTMGSRGDNKTLYRQYLNGSDNLIHLDKMRQWFAENTKGLLVVPRWVLHDALGAALSGNRILADIRCARTIIIRGFPYFFRKTNEFKIACLNDLARELAEHWRGVH